MERKSNTINSCSTTTTFSRNVLSIASGNVVAQFISFLAVPLITRIYSPEEFGVYSIILSAILIIGPVASLRYDAALLLPKEGIKAINLLALSLVICFVISTSLAAMIYFSPLPFLNFSITKEQVHYLWGIPIGIFFVGIYQNLTFYSIRTQSFRNLAVGRIGESLIDRSYSLFTGLVLKFGAWGLIGGRIFGPLSAIVFLYYLNLHNYVQANFRRLTVKRMLSQARRYKKFPLFSSWAAVLNTLAREVPTFLLAAYYSPAVAGFYGLGARIVRMPMMMIGDAISKVFFQQAAVNRDDVGTVKLMSLRLYRTLIIYSLPPTLLLILTGHNLFSVVFGSDWKEAGQFVRVLAPSFWIIFLCRPLSVFYDTYDRQQQRLFFDIVNTSLRILAIVAMASIGFAPLQVLTLLSVVTFLVVGTSMLFLFRIIGVSLYSVGKLFLLAFKISLPLIFTLSVGTFFLSEEKIHTWLIILTGCFLQAITLYIYSKNTGSM